MTLYLGIDIAKYDFTAAVHSCDGCWKVSHPKLPNNKTGWNEIKQWVNKQISQCGADSVHIGIESTGGYEADMVEWFRKETDSAITILNPVQVKRFIESQLIRTKTDTVDARMIAHYMAIHGPNPTPQTPDEVKQLKALTRHLEHLTRKRADELTYLESIRDQAIQSLAKQTIKSFDAQIKKVQDKIKNHLDNHPDLKAKRDLLKSIPGIGDITSVILLSEINGSLDPKQQAAHAGLAPREKKSGTLKGKTQLCKTGNKRLRTALYLPTLAAIRHNPVIANFYYRLLARGKPKMVAVAACMRKLLHICVGVLKNEMNFDPCYHQLALGS